MDKDCSTRKRDNYWCTYPASLFTALEVPSDPAKVVVMVIADSLGHLRLNLAITKLFRSDTISSFGSVVTFNLDCHIYWPFCLVICDPLTLVLCIWNSRCRNWRSRRLTNWGGILPSPTSPSWASPERPVRISYHKNVFLTAHLVIGAVV